MGTNNIEHEHRRTQEILNRMRDQEELSLPKIPLGQEHISNAKLLLDRVSLLKHMPQNGIVAEVGVDEGCFSREILRYARPSKLHLIDTWDSERYNEQKFQKVKRSFANEISAGLVEIHQCKSLELEEGLQNTAFDWVYIDTDHSFETTLKELFYYAVRVKDGGIISGHDYSQGNWVKSYRYGVIEALHKFCVEQNWEIIFLTIEPTERQSFAIRKLKKIPQSELHTPVNFSSFPRDEDFSFAAQRDLSFPHRTRAYTVHLISIDKFIKDYVDFVNGYFSKNDHCFIIYGAETAEYGELYAENVIWLHSQGQVKDVKRRLLLAGRIILHGLWQDFYLNFFIQDPGLLTKTIWVIWGGDLYRYRELGADERKSEKERVRAWFAQNVRFMAGIPGDYKYAREWYKTRAFLLEQVTIFYPSNLYRGELNIKKWEISNSTKYYNVLLGNSATPTNLHLDGINVLRGYTEFEFKVIAPLTYGNDSYRKTVIEAGFNLLGDKFVPLVEHLPHSKYSSLISSIHFMLLPHNRQQAFGTICEGLSKGSHILLRDNTSHFGYLGNLGFICKDFRKNDAFDFSAEAIEINHRLAKTHFSIERLIASLRVMFSV